MNIQNFSIFWTQSIKPEFPLLSRNFYMGPAGVISRAQNSQGNRRSRRAALEDIARQVFVADEAAEMLVDVGRVHHGFIVAAVGGLERNRF